MAFSNRGPDSWIGVVLMVLSVGGLTCAGVLPSHGEGNGPFSGTTDEVVCRWRESEIRVVADASVLESDMFANFGELDEFRIGLGEDGIWRSLVGFEELPSGEGEELYDAILHLYLKDSEGERRNSVRACRARLSWTEKGVTWRTLPPAAEPCWVTEIGTEVGRYDFDLTDYIAGVWAENFEDLGIVFNSLNERQLNTRYMHGRQSRDGRSQPSLALRTLPDPEGITATVALDPMPTGGRLYVNIVNEASAAEIDDVEWFALEQEPAWAELAGLSVAEDWSYENLSTICEQMENEFESDGLRASTKTDPIVEGQSREFEVAFHAATLPQRIVMHLSDEEGDELARLLVPVASLPSPTPTAQASSTPTDEPQSTPTRTATAQPVTATASATPSAVRTTTAEATVTPSRSATPTVEWKVYLPFAEVRRRSSS